MTTVGKTEIKYCNQIYILCNSVFLSFINKIIMIITWKCFVKLPFQLSLIHCPLCPGTDSIINDITYLTNTKCIFTHDNIIYYHRHIEINISS